MLVNFIRTPHHIWEVDHISDGEYFVKQIQNIAYNENEIVDMAEKVEDLFDAYLYVKKKKRKNKKREVWATQHEPLIKDDCDIFGAILTDEGLKKVTWPYDKEKGWKLK